jgi:(p)ppGpp synthase/HD superfamily hydrolase
MVTFDYHTEVLMFVFNKHHEQKRKGSGEWYVNHLLRVAATLARWGMDYHTINVGLLHDSIEDTDATHQELHRLFGKCIADDVLALTDCSKDLGSRKLRKEVDRARIRESNSVVKNVKLADMMDNMSNILTDMPDFAPKYLEEKRLMIDACREGSHPFLLQQADLVYQETIAKLRSNNA